MGEVILRYLPVFGGILGSCILCSGMFVGIIRSVNRMA